MFVIRPNQNYFMPVRELVPEAERAGVYMSIVEHWKISAKARQEILAEQEIPKAYFGLDAPDVSYWLKDEDLEELLNVSEQALAMDQAIPYELREVIRVLRATVERLDDACVVMSSHHVVMLR
jgi:hypothetical protein